MPVLIQSLAPAQAAAAAFALLAMVALVRGDVDQADRHHGAALRAAGGAR